MSRLQILADAIAQYEGFFVTQEEAANRKIPFPTIPQRFNNPGDLGFAAQPGAVRAAVKGRDGIVRWYAKFDTVENGWNALRNQIMLDSSRGLTLLQFLNKYAPSTDDNDPQAYARFVAKQMGVAVTTQLSQAIADA